MIKLAKVRAYDQVSQGYEAMIKLAKVRGYDQVEQTGYDIQHHCTSWEKVQLQYEIHVIPAQLIRVGSGQNTSLIPRLSPAPGDSLGTRLVLHSG